MEPKDRFAEKFVYQSMTGCWLWSAEISADGYGRFRLGKKVMTASRAAWLLFRGAIPEGLEPDHLCRVRRCVNPDHLELVTHRVNVQRGRDARVRLAEKLRSPEHKEDLRLQGLMNRVQEYLRKEAKNCKVGQTNQRIG